MDAKARANFINSVAKGQKIPCPNCNALNSDDAFFCTSCGTKLVKPAPEAQKPEPAPAMPNEPAGENRQSAFAPVRKPSGGARPVQPSAPARTVPAAEPVKKTADPVPAFKVAEEPVSASSEEQSVFAKGLPSWDVVPPQVVVRRKKK